MKLIIRTVIVVAALMPLLSGASIKLGSNRLIYSGDKSDITLALKNDDSRPFLVQSWVDAKGNALLEGMKLPFIIAPPLFQMDPGSENVIQLMYTGSGLPADRESLLWLNVKSVPSVKQEEKNLSNKMLLAVSNRMKVFYRPGGLTGSPNNAIKDLKWHQESNGTVIAKNDSPYYVVMNSVAFNHKPITISIETNNTVVPPFGDKSFTVKTDKSSSLTVNWSGINDYSMVSQTYSADIQ
ncbi:fimbrial biogenesis chaperone [Enterobacter sp. 22452]|uniref:fimbrial biogenesis chaperone n=1 Tax=Enterobacter TaxID=547 RepID=UPI003F84D9EE